MKPRTSIAIALTVALSAMGAPISALAEPADASKDFEKSDVVQQYVQNAAESIESFMETGRMKSSDTSGDKASLSSKKRAKGAQLPSSYSLRDPNGDGDMSDSVVTPVKSQGRWNSCWAFGDAAACEASILSSEGKSYQDTLESSDDPNSGLDLSELQTAWFAYTPLNDPNSRQNGEGLAPYVKKEGLLHDNGFGYYTASLYAAGVGPISEKAVPYKSKGGTKHLSLSGEPACYERDGDWSVDESHRFESDYELSDSSLLQSPATFADEKDEANGGPAKGTYRFDEKACNDIKTELRAGRGVAVCFSADAANPTITSENPVFINTNWAQYTYDDNAVANHLVCIVGYDDTYSKDKFGLDLDNDGEIDPKTQPSEDGAFLVKNSWGAGSQVFPNKGNWGIDEDGDGKGDGYFWISYYDRSLCELQTFSFDRAPAQGSTCSNVLDYMAASNVNSTDSIEPTSMANVFTAEKDQVLQSLSTETGHEGTSVTYQIYLLDDGWKVPTDGKLVKTVEDGPFTYAGYHRTNFDGDGVEVRKGQQFAVVATQTFSKDGAEKYESLVNSTVSKAAIDEGCKQAPDVFTGEYLEKLTYGVGVVNRGESWLGMRGDWVDWKDVTTYLGVKDSGFVTYDNFAIKAFGDAADLPDPEPAPEPGKNPSDGNGGSSGNGNGNNGNASAIKPSGNASPSSATPAKATKAAVGLAVGKSAKVSGNTYQVIGSDTVALKKAKNARKVSVPARVKIKGKSYRVTKVAVHAFTGSKINTVTLGKNVKKLSSRAFCASKAKTVVVKTKQLRSVKSVKGSFRGSRAACVTVRYGSVGKKYVAKSFTKKNTAAKKMRMKK